ncbi:MAG: acyl-CoA thioesterase [Bacteroidales bacterium]|nr:acyl-CoA thioesterase [Bacteroidales bacterium]
MNKFTRNERRNNMDGKIQIRVRYNETDSMRYLYHGNYASYYHASRTELLRSVGLSDIEFERQGVILPVIDLQSKYLKPAFYDDELIIKTDLLKISVCKLQFSHKVYNNKNEIINKGCSTVAYVDNLSRKPLRIPPMIMESLKCLIK